MFLATRPPGHLVRVDVLTSALQKGVRRGNFRVAAWGAVLLARAGYWNYVVRRLVTISCEDTNGITEPALHERVAKLVTQLKPRLEKRGVSKDTPGARRLLMELLRELVHATKTRMVNNAAAASLAYLAEESKKVHDELTSIPAADRRKRAFGNFRAAFRTARETAREGPPSRETLKVCLTWLAATDCLDASGDNADVWRLLVTADKTPRTKRLWELTHTIRIGGQPVGHARLAMYEAVLHFFFEPRAAPPGEDPLPSRRSDPKPDEAVWKELFEAPLEPRIRDFVDWDEWSGIVLDKHTAAGKDQDTAASLRARHPDFPERYIAPDHSGYSRASPVCHFFQTGAAVRNEHVVDPFYQDAKAFYWDIERGRSLPALKSGFRNAKAARIKARLGALINGGEDPAANKSTANRSVQSSKSAKSNAATLPTSRKRARSASGRSSAAFGSSAGTGRIVRTGSARPSRSKRSRTDNASTDHGTLSSNARLRSSSRGARRARSASTSRPDAPPMPVFTRVAHPVANAGTTTNDRAPRLLVGMEGGHDEDIERSGPVMVEDRAVTEAQMTQLPAGWKPASWICVLEDGESVWVKGCSEMNSTVPVYMDRIKSMFGLRGVNLRWTDNWLVAHDVGIGGPYPTVIAGARKYEVVDKTRTGAPMMRTAIDHATGGLPTRRMLEDTTRILLFRALFGINDTHLNNILWCEARQCAFSVDEMALTRDVVDEASTAEDITLENVLFSKVPKKSVLEAFQAYWSEVEVQDAVRAYLTKWSYEVMQLPTPPRPVLGLVSIDGLCKRVATLQKFFEPK